jgi:hypothetical protein
MNGMMFKKNYCSCCLSYSDEKRLLEWTNGSPEHSLSKGGNGFMRRSTIHVARILFLSQSMKGPDWRSIGQFGGDWHFTAIASDIKTSLGRESSSLTCRREGAKIYLLEI